MIKKLQFFLWGGVVIAGLGCSSAPAPVNPAQAVSATAGSGSRYEGGPMLVSLKAQLAPQPRLLVETTDSPVYTTYKPQDNVFVVDFPRMTKAADLDLPSNLPPFIASVAAEETLELGSPLTRLTIRLREPVDCTATADANGLVVTFDRTDAPATLVDQVPVIPEVLVETRTETAVPPFESSGGRAPAEGRIVQMTPPARFPSVPASRLERIHPSGQSGGLSVSLETDGRVRYKSFQLANPLRLVVDLEGVQNAVRTRTLELGDPSVRRVRVAQFQSSPSPVARVVFDLDEMVEYSVEESPRGLLVSFGSQAGGAVPARMSQPVPAEPVAIVQAVQPKLSPSTSYEAPRDAQHVIHAPTPQIPEQRNPRVTQVPTEAVAPAENVFQETPRAVTITGGIAPGQTRTLSGSDRQFTGEPISLNLTNADIRDVLRTFAELTGLNIAIDPGVTGTVTVLFEDVPWDQALDLILRQNNLTYSLQGNVMRIGSIQRITAEAKQMRDLEEQERFNVPLQTVIKYLSYAKATEVSTLLTSMLSPRGKIVVDTRTNQLIITEVPEFLQTLLNLIETIDIPTPQVLIEARIVETTKNFAQQLGVEWGFGARLDPALGTGTGLVFPNRVDIEGGPFSFGAGDPVLQLSLGNVLGTFDLDVLLTAAESEGLAKVVSAPRVMTQDNEPAQIESGVQIPIQTRVNFTTSVQYVNATLQLQVTPQVTHEGTVIMEIQVQKVEPALGLQLVGGANSPLITRRASTKLMVRDGGTTVIAGIYQATDNRAQSRLPFLHKIPVLGNLFKSHDISSRHDELLIFITPRIVRNT